MRAGRLLPFAPPLSQPGLEAGLSLDPAAWPCPAPVRLSVFRPGGFLRPKFRALRRLTGLKTKSLPRMWNVPLWRPKRHKISVFLKHSERRCVENVRSFAHVFVGSGGFVRRLVHFFFNEDRSIVLHINVRLEFLKFTQTMSQSHELQSSTSDD